MTEKFKVGDHVESEITFKGYTVHASKEEPQYLIKGDKI
jgi:hypothetical protein